MKSKKAIWVLSIFVFLLNASVFEIDGQNTAANNPVGANNSVADKKTQPTEIEKSENSDSRKNIDSTEAQKSLKNQNSERYRVGFQDTLEINVSRHPELSQTIAVSPDGTIFLPRIEQPILAYCKTEGELKTDITTLYKSYLKNPYVNVRVSDQKSQLFAVIGAVEKPGNYYLNRKVSLLELLSLAGGPDVEFAGGKIQLARTGNIAGCREDGETETETKGITFASYNLRDVLEGKQNPMMQPGDILSVLKSEEAYVVGNVFKPAKVPLNEPVTLTQAISIAGGRDATSNDKVTIERQAIGNSPKIDLVFSLKDIKNKKVPDPFLQANDTVNVGNDNVKSVRNGLLKAITGGLGNVFYRLP